MIDKEWTEADERHALHFVREAQASCGDPATASAVLATAAFWVLAQQVGMVGAAKIISAIAEATQRSLPTILSSEGGGDFMLRKVEIISGHREDSPDTPRWYVNHHYNDGSESIVDDKLTHAEAFASALEDASEDGCFPIHDNSTFR